MKDYFVNFYSGLQYTVFKFKNKKDALEKYNQLVDTCYFPDDCVFLNCVEVLSEFHKVESEE